MTDADEEMLLAAARRGMSPRAADSARVGAALAASLATSGFPPAAQQTSASRWVVRAPKLFTLLAVAGLSGGLGFVLGRSSNRAPQPVSITQPAASQQMVAAPRATPAAPPAVVPVVPTLKLSPSASRGTSVSAPEAAPKAEGLDEEVRTMRRVERSLRAGNPQLALALLEELERSVPRGKLSEERRAATTIARCSLGFGPSKQLLQEGFEKQYPSSMYLARVKRSCGNAAPEATESRRAGDELQ